VKKYFEKHSQQPVGRYVPHCPEQPLKGTPIRSDAGDSELDSVTFSDSCPEPSEELVLQPK
jgi:hypothetical protein